MGTASSLQSTEPKQEDNFERNPVRKSIRGEFEKEFGKNYDEQNSSQNDNAQINYPSAPSNSNRENQILVNPAVFRAKRLFMKPVMKNRPKQQNVVVKKQKNSALLKEIYHRMDPAVSAVSSRIIVGEIEVAAKYKVIEKTLLLKVGRAKDLQKSDGVGFPHPYVVADLFPASDPTKVLSRQTSIKSNSTHPAFQEILVFPLAEQQIADTKLRVTVWDKDLISQDDFLGESQLELCKLDLNAGNTMWYKLHPQTDMSISGSVDVSINFNEPNNVIVTIHQANGVKICSDQASNPYVRLFVTGLPNKLETSVKENTLDPVWEESFEFNVHRDEFSRRIIVLNVLSKELCGSHDKHLGDVHIPLIDFNTEEQFQPQKIYPLQDLRNMPHSRSKWSEDGLSIEFREAMEAHAIYGYPKFFFKKEHKGKMMVSCHSKKARTEAKMIISNGIPSTDIVQM